MAARAPGMHNITRLDYERTHAWWVRIQRWIDGVYKCVVSKMFSDAKWGGKHYALQAAIKFRNKELPKWPTKSGRKGGGRKPLPAGHSYITRMTRTIRRANGTSYDVDIIYAMFKPTIDSKVAFQSTVSVYGLGKAKEMARRWVAKQKRELKRRAA